jgi:hypothetical protein
VFPVKMTSPWALIDGVPKMNPALYVGSNDAPPQPGPSAPLVPVWATDVTVGTYADADAAKPASAAMATIAPMGA